MREHLDGVQGHEPIAGGRSVRAAKASAALASRDTSNSSVALSASAKADQQPRIMLHSRGVPE